MTTTNHIIRRAAIALSLASLGALGVTACTTSTPTATAPVESPAASSEQNSPVTFTDPWMKATDGSMTGVFGTLKNTSATPLTISSVDFDGAGMVELHETVIGEDGSSVMQPAEHGFTIPAGGEFKLEPGANHIMLMDLTKPIEVGKTYDLTLHFSDGSMATMSALAKEYTGAQESYAPDGSMNGGHGDHSGHEGHAGHEDHAGHGAMSSETPAP